MTLLSNKLVAMTWLFQVSQTHQSLSVQIPEVIGIPMATFTVLMLIGHEPFTAERAAGIGMELSILAAGACGSIFANDTLVSKWGTALNVYGMLTIVACIGFAAGLARISRRQQAPAPIPVGWRPPPVGVIAGMMHLTLGAIPLGIVTAILILGYTFTR